VLLGSYSELEKDWLWGWAQPHLSWDSPLTADLRSVYDLGIARGIPELTNGGIALSDFAGPAQAARMIAIAASVTLGGNGAWAVSTNHGQTVVFLQVNDPQIPLARFELFNAPLLLSQAIDIFPRDHRLVVRGFLEHYRIPVVETADQIIATTTQGTLIALFDRYNRLTGIQSH